MCLTRSKDWKIDGGNPSGGRRCVSRARFRIADMGRMVFDKRNPRPLIFVQKKSSIKKRNMASVDFKGANMGNFLKSEGVLTKSHFTTFLGFWEGRRLTEVDRSTSSSEVVRVVPLLLSSSWQEADWGWQINRVTSGIGVRGQLSSSHLDVSKLHYFRIHPPTIALQQALCGSHGSWLLVCNMFPTKNHSRQPWDASEEKPLGLGNSCQNMSVRVSWLSPDIWKCAQTLKVTICLSPPPQSSFADNLSLCVLARPLIPLLGGDWQRFLADSISLKLTHNTRHTQTDGLNTHCV